MWRNGFSILCGCAAMVALLALGAGCKTHTVNTVQPAIGTAAPNIVADKRVVTDSGLSGKVAVVLNTATNDQGFLIVQATLQNRTTKRQTIQYRFDWTDAKGMAVATPASRWQLAELTGGDTTRVSGTAPRVDVKDFQFKLQRY